jgi:exodeoxyribonuclease VII large subunit
MATTRKSHLDFGELFPPATLRRVFSVAELTGRIRSVLEGQVGQVAVQGEVTGLRTQSSGHCYFALKDAQAQVSCVLFRQAAAESRHCVFEGAAVVLEGDITVYEPRGQYQLVVRAIEARGAGALQAAFERLKQKLRDEGLFSAGRKRPMPLYPRRVGLVTSPTGAALRDVVHVVGRRFAGLELVLAPSRVQGEGAAGELAAALAMLNEWSASGCPGWPGPGRLDAIVLTRGGGSLEDLWAFNDEGLARAIAASMTPVISAVGHEIDFTISDFVADLRAATPSAAAEILTQGYVAARSQLAEMQAVLGELAWRPCRSRALVAEQLRQRLQRQHPRRHLESQAQRLDDGLARLDRSVRRTVADRRSASIELARRWLRLHPARLLALRSSQLLEGWRRLREQANWRIETHRARLKSASESVQLLSPQSILRRGYSITLDAVSRRVLRDAREVRPGDSLVTRLAEGEVVSRVESRSQGG